MSTSLPSPPEADQASAARTAPAIPPVLALDHLSVSLGGRPILKDLNAQLRGHCIGLLGPNGAGKSTLLNTLLGFHPPLSGDAHVLGRSIRTTPLAAKSLLGFMPERDAFIPGMSAVHFLRLMGELSGFTSAEALERAHELLFLVGLGEVRYRSVETYSLGLKQRTRLAQALMHSPRLLLLDEPTNGLDPNARQQLLRLIQDIRDQGQTHILLSSHLLKDVEECCDEVLILHQGQVVEQCDLGVARRASSRFIELELAGAEEARATFLAALTGEGCTMAPGQGGKVKGLLGPDLDVQGLFRHAQAAGVQLRRLGFQRQSLEEIFFRAIGELDGRS